MARFCTSCGAEIADGLRFCTECGASLDVAETAPSQAGGNQGSYAPRQSINYNTQQPSPYGSSHGPAYNPGLAYGPGASAPVRQQNASPPEAPRSSARKAPGPNSPYAPVTTWGFVGTMLLLSIPIVGLVLAIVWACGGCRKINKRNLSRAFLILMVIGLILGLVAGLMVRGIVKSALKEAGLSEELPDGGLGSLGELATIGDSDEEGGDGGSLLDGLGALAAIGALGEAADSGSSNDDLAALGELADMMEGLEGLTGEESSADGLNDLIDNIEEQNAEFSASHDGWPAALRPYPGGKAEAVETYRTEITDTSLDEMKAWIEDLKGDGFEFQDFYDFGFTEEDMLGMNAWWATDGNIYLSVSYVDGVVTIDHTNELPDLESYFG